MSELTRLIYRSRSALEGTASDVERGIEQILEQSNRRNGAADVTGALMFTRLLFVQALEGPAPAVEAAFDRICCDLRHTGVEIIEYGPIPVREFGRWSMSHLVPDGRMEVLLDPEAAVEAAGEMASASMRLMAALLRASLPAHADGRHLAA